MGPGLVTTTQASRQKNRVAMTTVKTENRKKARKNCVKSSAHGASQQVFEQADIVGEQQYLPPFH